MDLLPEIAAPPHFVPAPEQLLPAPLRAEVDGFLAGAGPPGFLLGLRSRLSLAPAEALACGTKYNVPLVNALAFYLGVRAVEAAPPKPGTSPAMATPHMEVLQHLLRDLDTGGWARGLSGYQALARSWPGERNAGLTTHHGCCSFLLVGFPLVAVAPRPPPQTLLLCSCRNPASPPFSTPHPPTPHSAEGRYLLINALANHLRFPNAHTHYFSCAILSLFTEAGSELIQEQITRVLLERLIVNRCGPPAAAWQPPAC